MKVKELHKTVNVAWSPQVQQSTQFPILLAAGTAAQQLDASFSTNASLDLYSLNLQQPGYDMLLKTSVPSDQRFHKIIWGASGSNPAGIIVGGCDYGKIKVYSAAKMLENDSKCLISSPEKHKGPVKALDFNTFQSHLLATGATESEIYIWDLNDTAKPMSPGSKNLPAEDVQYIAWNKQVQHILASNFSQRCVIWDLRKNEAIIKLTDANARVRWKSVQWHPDVATQLCLASEDDQTPIIELWDLRFATSPLRTMQNHQRGVLSIAWNSHDSDLLLSCAKDNRILCWNPNSDVPNGDVICELAQTNQWNFDVSWCPRSPGLVVGTSSDGLATVYSLLGGANQRSGETSDKIVDSFPGMDPFTQAPPTVQTEAAAVLRKAPKWLKKPVGASFGFGGKLTVFENEQVDPNVPASRKVYVSQVVTNPELIKRSNDLESALKNGQFYNFCNQKVETAADEHNKKVWSCIGAYFSDNVTQNLLSLLGFNIDEMNNKLNQFLPQQEVDTITDGISNLNNGINGNAFDGNAAFDAIAEQEQNKKSVTPKKSADINFKLNTSNDEEGLITQAILLGNIEAAVTLCFENKKYTDAIILAMAGGPELLAQTQYRYFNEHSGALNSLINSVVSENWVDIVKNCDINCWKEALIGVFTHTNPEERSALCDILGDRLASSDNPVLKKDAQICFICSGNLSKTIDSSNSEIQETVELVTIMQKALEFHSTRKLNVDSNIASVLTRYAEMLAAEGDFEAALSYLGDSQEPSIGLLRDRLYKALGLVSIKPQPSTASLQASYGNQNVYSHSAQRKSIPGGAVSSFAPVQPIPAAPASQVPAWNTAPTKQPFGGMPNQSQPSPYGGVVTNQPYGTPSIPAPSIPGPPLPNQPTPFDPYAQQQQQQSYGQAPLTPSVPPPPPTGSSSSLSGSRPPSVGPHSKSKYIIDPSVKSGPSYGSNYASPGQTMYGGMSQPQTFPSAGSFPGQTSYQPQTMGGYTGGYGTNPAQSTIYNPAEPELQTQLRPSQPSLMNPTPVKPQTIYDPSSSQQNIPGVAAPPPQTTQLEYENTYQPGSQSSGWNDPPASSKSNKSLPKTEYQRHDPIVHPLGAGAQPEPVLYPQNPGYQQPGIQSNYPDPHAAYNQYGQSMPSPGVPQQFNRPAEPIAPVQPAQVARVPEPEKPKAPIPEEHVVLQTVLNELKDRCFENAKNPQVKRKITDVAKKLEVLYDSLREQKISPNTLQGLHQIINLIQNGNYPEGLSIHTQLVSGPDFSQIASFMPGIKVLLQSALQLGVYIR